MISSEWPVSENGSQPWLRLRPRHRHGAKAAGNSFSPQHAPHPTEPTHQYRADIQHSFMV